MAMNNGGKDNITIILLKVTESTHTTSDFTHYTTKYQNNINNTQNIPRIENPSIDTQTGSKNNQKILIGVVASLLVFIGVYFAFFNSSDGAENGIKENKQINRDNVDVNKDQPEESTNTDNDTKEKNIIESEPQKEEINNSQNNNPKQNVNNNKNEKQEGEKNPKKDQANTLEKQYNSACEDYKKLCEEKNNIDKTNEKGRLKNAQDIKSQKNKLDKILIDWKNTGLWKQQDECNCN
jgi:hypothetical protein